MDLGDIQRGRGRRFRVRGTSSKFLMVWNFTSTPLSSVAGGSLSRNALLTQRYQAWHQVGRLSSLAWIAKWSDMYMSSERCRSLPRMYLHIKRKTALCVTFVQVFRSKNRRLFRKCQTRSIRTNSVRRSGTCWLHEIWVLSRSTLKLPRKMGSRPLNICIFSSKFRRCSRVEGGRYTLTSRVRVCPVTISQLTTFGSWKRVDSISHLLDCSLLIRSTRPCALTSLDRRATKSHNLVGWRSIPPSRSSSPPGA